MKLKMKTNLNKGKKPSFINTMKTPAYKKVQCKKTGRWMLEEDGYTDDWKEMQLKAQGTELKNYVEIDENNEMVANNRISEISKETPGEYMDISHISTNKIENHNAVQRGKQLKAEADWKAKEFAKWEKREAKKANDLEKARKEVQAENTTKVDKDKGDK